MVYKIFLSYCGQETELAEFIRNVLNKAFKNKVAIIFNNIRGGEKWKDSILKGLHESDAILTLLTPQYLKKPWAYIEWAAFWLRDKVTYVAVTDDVEFKDIVEPIKDVQFTKIFSEPDVIKLLEAIAEKSESEYIPYEIVNELVNKSKAIYEKIISNYEKEKYAIFKNNTHLLPNDDYKKIEILWYYYEKEGDRASFKEVLCSINDSSIKANILLTLLGKRDVDLIEDTYECVEIRSNLVPLAKSLMENGYENTELIEKILQYIASSQTALRTFCEYLVKNGWIDSKVLSFALPLFNNRAELRRLGECIIENGKVQHEIFDTLIQYFYGYNHAELQKLLKHVIEHKSYNKAEVTEQITRLSHFNQREAEKLITLLIKKDIELAKHILYDLKLITNEECFKRLDELIKNYPSH